MSFTFQQGTKLIIDDGANRYEYLISSGNAAQTFVETEQVVNTIQSPNLVKNTFVKKKGNASVDFEVYLGSGEPEKAILEWFGFAWDAGNSWSALTFVLNTVDIYFVTNNEIYKIDTCVGQNISFKLNKGILSLAVNATGRDLTTVASVPATGTLYSQSSSDFYATYVTVDGYSNIEELTCELTRDVTWLDQMSVHNSGTYTPDTPVLTSIAISGKIQRYKTESDSAINYVPQRTIIIRYGNSFTIRLENCNTTDRFEMDEVHRFVTDYKYLSGYARITL